MTAASNSEARKRHTPTAIDGLENLRQEMQEYAHAVRGDWSDFDGRSNLSIIEDWIEEMRHPSPNVSMAVRRSALSLCKYGLGHWAEYCDDECQIEGSL